MAINATIIAVKQTADQVCLSVRVDEPNDGAVEYTGCVANDDVFKALPLAQKKAALVAATRDVRNKQMNAPVDVAGITGSVSL